MTAKIIVLGWGNPSRGDDALGPALLDHLQRRNDPRLTCLGDFQLQPEHALDLLGQDVALFIDAAVNIAPPWQFTRLQPQADRSFSSHALSPNAVLAVYEQVQQTAPPPAYLLAVRGYQFELGADLGPEAVRHLAAAERFLDNLLQHPPTEWDGLITAETRLA